MQETDTLDITKMGLLDRENVDMPYASGYVALLGDAAHPQIPLWGKE
jgi:hypothetical protein